MATISKVAEILESYRGRDKIIRLLSYSSLFVGGSLSNSKFKALSESLVILFSKLSECRTMLRLFDDLSMFLHCKQYGLGLKENDGLIQLTTLINNFFMQAYYPIEHIAWARDKAILTGNSGKLWTLGILLWLGSLCMSIIKSLWLLKKLQKEMNGSCDGLEDKAVHYKSQWYHVKQKQLIVTAIGSLADACNAVNWLPKGFLWSGKFNRSLVGLMGMISSAALMYNHLNPVPPKDIETVNKDS